jgi:hypothetical protein
MLFKIYFSLFKNILSQQEKIKKAKLEKQKQNKPKKDRTKSKEE